LEAGQIRVERLRTDPGRVEECLLLVDAGATRFSGINNWEVFKGQIDGDVRVRESLSAIAVLAGQAREALLRSRFADVTGLIRQEWEARKRLAPGVTTPDIDRIVEVVGAGGSSPCGRRPASGVPGDARR
jgi:D-glycero-alpha-D-manno-heptose-7-phosphate kinase